MAYDSHSFTQLFQLTEPTVTTDQKELLISPVVAEILRGRRTIGAFRPELPSHDLILQALELARWAPNHKKTEPWSVVSLGPEAIRSVVEINSQILTASKGPAEAEAKAKKWLQVPGWLVVLCDQTDDPFRREEDYAACCCMVQNLCLALWSAGIGTKWSTGDVTRHPDFFRLLGLDSTKTRVVGMVWYGYPAVVPEQTRKPVASFLRELP